MTVNITRFTTGIEKTSYTSPFNNSLRLEFWKMTQRNNSRRVSLLR